jgi:hypothetical protein
MKIADLNHLETVEANIVGGITNRTAIQLQVFKQATATLNLVKSKADVKGNSAFSEGDALAVGDNSFTSTTTVTYADDYMSGSSSTSQSAVD